MIPFIVTILCLIISFALDSKKMKIKSIFQAILSVILSLFVFFLLPDAPFTSILEEKIGEGSFEIIQDILNEIAILKISILDIIFYAIIFLTILSVLEIIEFVKSHFLELNIQKRIVHIENHNQKKSHFYYENKIYILFCRILS